MLELPRVQDRPQLFSTFLMWLLADLFHDLPEVGDLDKPKLVFFFDEAHLLFNDASKDFLDAIQQTVRLIRSKGVGVFFVTQSPKDVPADVLAQLGNRVQHALRAFTPDDAKALKAAVRTYPNTAYDLEELLTQLGTGEAVITVLSEKGAPTPVAWTRMRAPESLMAPSPDALLDPGASRRRRWPRSTRRPSSGSRRPRCSARPRSARTEAEAAAALEAENAKVREAAAAAAEKERLAAEKAGRQGGRGRREGPGGAGAQARRQEPRVVEAVVKSSAFKSVLRSAGTVLGREITRSIFGTSRRRSSTSAPVPGRARVESGSIARAGGQRVMRASRRRTRGRRR